MLIKYQNWHSIPIDAHQTFNDLLVKVKACVSVWSGSWVNTALAKVHHLAAPTFPLEHGQHFPQGPLTARMKNNFQKHVSHTQYI